ncbi:MAG: hypothetical protein NZM35_00220 [Chitinophagales bacterium]|nr:hypothetical protein [Chitinophagales bacterium]MDW8417870.1 hypothetical protein [Chitinophagales bacterium]
MKKFCGTCGAQLELSKRYCGECGQVNPFFVQSFSILADQAHDIEKLRAEKERIERELQEKEKEQEEFLRQEEIRRRAEEEERMRIEAIAREQLRLEQEERRKAEAQLKEEIHHVKQEAERHKQVTLQIVNEVREEIQHLEEENKRLKKELEELAHKNAQVKNFAAPAPPPPVVELPDTPAHTHTKITPERENTLPPPPQTKQAGPATHLKPFLIALPAILILAAWLYYHLKNLGLNEQVKNHSAQLAMNAPGAAAPDTLGPVTPASPTVKENRKETPKTDIPATTNTTEPFRLTGERVAQDVVGKKISGCDITIRSIEEVRSVSPPVLIEQLSSGTVKYKCTLRVAQGDNSYVASPYLYYTPAGKFLKIDGTNCE